VLSGEPAAASTVLSTRTTVQDNFQSDNCGVTYLANYCKYFEDFSFASVPAGAGHM